jgi:glutamyl-Q tRNA(Asp) synthetase
LNYVGRFAPSPTGALHAGSLVAALGSWLDARAARGRWLVRIEDVDLPRCVSGAAEVILEQLVRCGLIPDEPPWRQSRREAAYVQALDTLRARGLAYECGCTRREIDEVLLAAGVERERHAERIYPGTCRNGLQGKPARAVRLLTLRGGAPVVIDWHDRRLGAQRQDVTHEVGDFVLRRADGLWAYQLAVVSDDSAQGVTHVVRGEDLADNTPRQMLLQRDLGVPAPSYLHLPLVLAADGHKLGKQNGAQPLDLSEPTRVLGALREAANVLGLPALPARAASPTPDLPAWLEAAVRAWAEACPLAPSRMLAAPASDEP